MAVHFKRGCFATSATERSLLADILRDQRQEVTDMLLTEYNEQAHLQSEREIAIEEGKQIGAKQLGKLISALLSEGRTEDAARAATDEAFRGQMYEKYGIKN